MTKDQLFHFIQGQMFGVLSTVNAGGTPEAALVGIAVTRELEIVFDTLKTTRKYANLCVHPAVAFVVGCMDEATLQYEGTAMEAVGAELERVQEVYFATFADGLMRKSWAGICYIVVKPKWIRFSDYGETPAVIEELRF